MGYRNIPTIYTLEFPQYEGLEVRMKGLKIGKMRQVVRQLDDDDATTEQVVTLMVETIAKNLVSWTLLDEAGEPVEISEEAIDDIEFPMLQAIMNKWLDEITGPDDDLGKDSSSGDRFPGQPVTMEAL